MRCVVQVCVHMFMVVCVTLALFPGSPSLDKKYTFFVRARGEPGNEASVTVCVFLPQIKLQQLQQQCEPVSLPDATCRYGSCLQHHASTSIIVKDPGIRVCVCVGVCEERGREGGKCRCIWGRIYAWVEQWVGR